MDPRDRGGRAQPLLIVEDLRKHFPVRGGLFNRRTATVQAVDDLSFSVRKGEVLGVVGESGCGKSTTARLLMRLIEPDAGAMIFDGEIVGDRTGISVNAMRKQVQMVFQDSYASLNPRMTIAESICYAPRMHGLPARAATERAEALLAEVGLNPRQFARRYPHELSGGQRQRVNIARALALEPRLVILDEAVSALDKSVAAQVLNLLQALKERFNLTYLFISHDLNVVEYVSDRVLVMYLGRVVETGPVAAIYERPRHPYTRALFASKPTLDPARRTTVMPLAGDPPNPINPPSGCRFRTRCAFAQAICSQQAPALEPPLEAESPAPAHPHLVACHLVEAQTASGGAPAVAEQAGTLGHV
ncbi:MAG: ABC transporter ATP-binding protein [Acetobacteraceae bacterium]|nr:ABC transporter ATP-binding protein [Acetobacteraceae bacterium]